MYKLISALLIVFLLGAVAFLWWKLSVATTFTTPINPTDTTTKPKKVPVAPKPVVDARPLSAKVTVATPAKNAKVTHALTISGKAPGPWFFEASFPVQVRDAQDAIIGRTVAQAHGEWMTEALVDFTATVPIDASYHGPATLVLLRDNPSGLPENDDSVSIPIIVE